MTNADTLEVAPPRPTLRHKSFAYRTSTEWTSGRSGALSAAEKPTLSVSSPREFKGESGRWTPEDLFVAAVEVCTMTTFLSFAQRLALPLLAYRSEAEGHLEFVDDGYRFTRVVLRPTIVLSDPAGLETATRAMRDAHDACLIARSVRAEVVVEPRFQVEEPPAA
jgi:organic hydroperoxide reductase OsmC/OhrA